MKTQLSVIIVFAVACIAISTVVLAKENYIFSSCKSERRVLSEGEVVDRFITQLIKQDSLFLNAGTFEIFQKQVSENGNAKTQTFKNAQAYFKDVPDCCVIGTPPVTYPNDVMFVQVQNPPWYLTNKVAAVVSWKPAAVIAALDAKTSVTYLEVGQARPDAVYWLQTWVGYCGEPVAVPLRFQVG